MRVFLLSDLVVHELASMQLEGKWLTSQNFSESARLWLSRYAPESQLSNKFLSGIEQEAIRIATQLAADKMSTCGSEPLTRLFVDIPIVSYAHPLSVLALSASLAACRENFRDIESASESTEESPQARPACVGMARSSSGCHPALRALVHGCSLPPLTQK